MSDSLLGELLVKIGAKKDTNFNTVLGEVKDEVEKTTGNITEFGTKAALAFSAIGMSGLVITKGWVDAAARMEQYKATLTAVLHSQEAATAQMSRMVKFASTTPFDIPQVVQAGVTLQSLGQDIDKLLPVAGDLAAVMGRSIPEAALALGKAASGSLDGVTMLADSWGISRQKMIQFGAVANDQGEIQAKTAAQVEKLRTALVKIVKTEFGGAMAAQSQTLVGAFSNLQDSIGQISASLGAELSPFITSVTRSVTSMLSAWELVPGPIKTVIAFGTLAGSVFTLLAGGALGAGVAARLAASEIIAMGAALGMEGTTAAGATLATKAWTVATTMAGGAASIASDKIDRLKALNASTTITWEATKKFFIGIPGYVATAIGSIGAFMSTSLTSFTALEMTSVGTYTSVMSVSSALVGMKGVALAVGAALGTTAAAVLAVAAALYVLRATWDQEAENSEAMGALLQSEADRYKALSKAKRENWASLTPEQLQKLGVSQKDMASALQSYTDQMETVRANEALSNAEKQRQIALLQQQQGALRKTAQDYAAYAAYMKEHGGQIGLVNTALNEAEFRAATGGTPTAAIGLKKTRLEMIEKDPNLIEGYTQAPEDKREAVQQKAILELKKDIWKAEHDLAQQAIADANEQKSKAADLAELQVAASQRVLQAHERQGKGTIADQVAVTAAVQKAAKAKLDAEMSAIRARGLQEANEGRNTGEAIKAELTAAQKRYTATVEQEAERRAQVEKDRQREVLGFHKDVLSARSAGLDLELQRLQALQSQGINVESQIQAKQQQRLQMAIDLHNVETRLATSNAKSPAERTAIEQRATLQETNIRQRFYQEETQRQYQRWKTQHDYAESTILDEKKLAVEVAKYSHDTIGIRIAEAQSREAIIQKAIEDARQQGISEVEIARRTSLMRKQFLLEDQKARQQAFESMEEEIVRVTQGDLAAEILRIQKQAQTYKEQTGPEGEAKVSQWLAAKKQDLLKKEADALGKVGEAADKSADSVDKLNKSFEKLGGANSPLISLEEMAAGMSMFSNRTTSTAAALATSSKPPPSGALATAAAPGASTFPSNTERINAGLGGGGVAGGAGGGMADSVVAQINAAMSRPGITEGDKARLAQQRDAWLRSGSATTAFTPKPGTPDVSGIMSQLAGMDPSSPDAKALMARAGMRDALGGLSGLPTVPSKGALVAAAQGSSASPGVSSTVSPPAAAGTPATSSGGNTTNTFTITVNGQQVSGDVKDPARLRQGLGHVFGAVGLERFADTGGR